MDHEKLEKLITRLFDKSNVSAVKLTQMNMSVSARMPGVHAGTPEITAGFQALLLDGGRHSGTIKIESMALGAAMRNEKAIEKVKRIKKQKEEASVNFMDELKKVED
jgi:hypothetical protein